MTLSEIKVAAHKCAFSTEDSHLKCQHLGHMVLNLCEHIERLEQRLKDVEETKLDNPEFTVIADRVDGIRKRKS